MVCQEHSGLIVMLKNIEDKLDEQVEHCKNTTNCTNDKFTHIEVNMASLNSKVDWLVIDRQEQMKRYEAKTAWRRKIHYSVTAAIVSLLSTLFVKRNEIRDILKEWLL